MYKSKIIVSFFLSLAVVTAAAQTGVNAAKKKKTVITVKAHRGTVVTETIHEKVNKLAQTRYAALPKLESVTETLPLGASPVKKDSVIYYYKNGFYYLQDPKGFRLVIPVAGVRIHGLPMTYRRLAVGERTYFYYYGVFYEQAGNSDDYEVVVAPEGAVVDAIPDGYKVQKVENIEYYLLNDVYYAEIEVKGMDGNTGYKVVTIIQAY